MPCVLKEYDLDAAGKGWAWLVREVSVLRRLEHPRLVRVEAVFQDVQKGRAPVAYVQLPLYERGDARRWVDEEEPVRWKRQRMLTELAEALRHLHAHGFAHGDVKLENVLVDASERAYLADFESAREAAASDAAPPSKSSGRVATARYKAPELHAGGGCARPTAATDMYAFGVCALLACCDVGDYVFGAPPQEQLQPGWSREAAAAKGGEHLPALLEELLDLGLPPAASPAEALTPDEIWGRYGGGSGLHPARLRDMGSRQTDRQIDGQTDGG